MIRGGVLDIRDVTEQAEDEFRRCGTYSISVNSAAGLTLEEVADAARRPNPKIRKTTAGRLRSRGFNVTPPKGTRNHCNLLMAEQRTTTSQDWQVLVSLFDTEEENPYRREQ